MAHVANEKSASGVAHVPSHGVSHDKTSLWAMALGSVGVVYGDIGTSPLYAFRVAVVAATESGPVTRTVVLGVLSLILWSLIVVVTLKYVVLLLRAALPCFWEMPSSHRRFPCCRRWKG
jgi:KUP system potassium uptake protein